MRRYIGILLTATLAPGAIRPVPADEGVRSAPECALTSIDDARRLDLAQFRGKVVYLDFWASWCPPCVKSFPFLNQLDRDLEGQGLAVIGVNLDERPEDAEAFLAVHPARFTVAADRDFRCAKDFDVEAMPSSYLVDRRGIIRHVHRGFRAGEADDLRARVERLLAEPPAGN
jgi:thiol-disulfide isomerase/thioredoxin